ncbi:hypothetical protein [Streptomyces qaidamensis]|nr:hypothetical protein [Streptomyces qaidamensis]
MAAHGRRRPTRRDVLSRTAADGLVQGAGAATAGPLHDTVDTG